MTCPTALRPDSEISLDYCDPALRHRPGSLRPTQVPCGGRPLAGGAETRLGSLEAEAKSHPALAHDWLKGMAESRYADMGWALRDFAREYHTYSAGFPGYLTRVIEKLHSPAHRRLLGMNLQEERGSIDPADRADLERMGIDVDRIEGVSHADLYLRFCGALGLESSQLRRRTVSATKWREDFSRFLENASPAAAVGALGLGTENIVRSVYLPLSVGIRASGLVSDEDSVFFALHCEVDDQHALDLRNVARDLLETEKDFREMRMGMREALRLRHVFFSHLHRRASNITAEELS